MPAAIPARAAQASNVQQAALVCNGWGHCWHQPGYGDGFGYFHPHYYGVGAGTTAGTGGITGTMAGDTAGTIGTVGITASGIGTNGKSRERGFGPFLLPAQSMT
jgi:hypothetical protein